MGKVRNVKFVAQIDRQVYKLEICKSRSNGCRVGHLTYFSFRTSLHLLNDIHYVHRITCNSMSKNNCAQFCTQWAYIMVRHGANFAAQMDFKKPQI